MPFRPSILPFEVVSPTALPYVQRITTRSQIIYITVLLFFFAAMIALPFLRTPVSVKARGIIRPATEVSTIRSLVNGRIEHAFIVENRYVKRGDVLFALASDPLSEKEQFYSRKLTELRPYLRDLTKLLAGSAVSSADLETSIYRQSYYNHLQRLGESDTRCRKTRSDFERNEKLHRQMVIADAELENYRFELDRALHERALLEHSQLAQWQQELRSFEKDIRETELQLRQLSTEKENLIVRAPVAGTVQNVAGIYPGSLVISGQDLAQISPDTGLIAEAFVSPNDIGLLRNEMSVRLQVDAFNYNQWGLASGRIVEISQDIQFVDEAPVFLVRCAVDRDHLQLRNGYRGYIKKGMTFQARFRVTSRSLWQLLYDRIDDWLNPALARLHATSIR